MQKIENLVSVEILLSSYNHQFEPDAKKMSFQKPFSSKNPAIILKNA